MAEGYQLLYVQLEGLHLERDGEGSDSDSACQPSASDSSSGCSSSGAVSVTGGLFSVLPLRRRRSSQRLAARGAR